MLPDFTPVHSSIAKDNLLDALRLIRSENVGPVTFFHLIRRYQTAERALEMIPDLARRGGRARPIQICPQSKAETEIEKAQLFGARFLKYGEPDYPGLLLAIPDPPPVISILGHPRLWGERKTVAMVGARNASANGCNFAKKLARELGEAGYTVISGLARGIDAFVHRGALATGTVGVIAGGIDNVYPPENKPLFDEMRERGAILSENPFGAEPLSRSFPARNRLISGMSLGVIVVEASRKSGSLITAEFALDQNREVFAVPGSPMDPRAQGCNDLIRQGATLATTLEDVLSVLSAPRGPRVCEPHYPTYEEEMVKEPSAPELAEARRLVEEKLGLEPVEVEELLLQSGLGVNLLQTILLEKELAGVLQRHPGGKVSLIFREEEALV